MKRVLIIGGYGNFGSVIAQRLAADDAMALTVAGRDGGRAARFADTLDGAHPAAGAALDIFADNLGETLSRIDPQIVIHTTGPFQTQDDRVARACAAQGRHYIDLADSRSFVTGVGALDAEARARDALIVSGASSVPALTAAVIDHFAPAFARLESIDSGISAAQQTNRGVATMAAILSYVGRPFTALRDGAMATRHGWHGARSMIYPGLGRRWLGDCDVPDLALFPERYPALREHRFAAGNELPIAHFAAWALGWPVRWGVVRSLQPLAPLMVRLARLLDPFGSSKSGFHMILRGVDAGGAEMERRFYLIARSGHGPQIPCIPAILLARRLARGAIAARGARPCLDLITLADYLNELKTLDITPVTEPADAAPVP